MAGEALSVKKVCACGAYCDSQGDWVYSEFSNREALQKFYEKAWSEKPIPVEKCPSCKGQSARMCGFRGFAGIEFLLGAA